MKSKSRNVRVSEPLNSPTRQQVRQPDSRHISSKNWQYGSARMEPHSTPWSLMVPHHTVTPIYTKQFGQTITGLTRKRRMYTDRPTVRE